MHSTEPARTLVVLTPENAAQRLSPTLAAWRVEDGVLQRSLRTAGWQATLMAANAIAHLAEVAWHHPELRLTYARVDIRLWTHDAGGITEKDLALAERIEAMLAWRPGVEPGAVLTGTPGAPGPSYLDYD